MKNNLSLRPLLLFGIFAMKAAVIHGHGGLDRIRIEQVSDPEPTKDEVILNVHSAGLNHLDIWVRKRRA